MDVVISASVPFVEKVMNKTPAAGPRASRLAFPAHLTYPVTSGWTLRFSHFLTLRKNARLNILSLVQ